jgi:hypothetical protein
MTFALQMDMVPAINMDLVAVCALVGDDGCWKTGLNK